MTDFQDWFMQTKDLDYRISDILVKAFDTIAKRYTLHIERDGDGTPSSFYVTKQREDAW